jgi:hypothetical protein
MELGPSWEAASCATTQELPKIFGNRRYITMFTRVLPWSLYWARSIQSIPYHSFYPRSILLLSSTHLRLGLPNDLFPSGFLANILYAILDAPIRPTCLAHLILLDLINLIILPEEYNLWSSSLSYFLQLPHYGRPGITEYDIHIQFSYTPVYHFKHYTQTHRNIHTRISYN